MAFLDVSPLMREGRLSISVYCPGNQPLYQANFVGLTRRQAQPKWA